MYVAEIPNRNSPPAILLREGYREGGKAKSRTLANLTHWRPERIEALKRALKGEFDGLVGEMAPVCDRIFGVLFVLERLADRIGIRKALGRSPMGKVALFLVLARVADQGSRLSASRWAKDHCVAEILGLCDVEQEQLYQALDWLFLHQDKIEKKLYRAYAKKKGSPHVLVLYDVTSSYLEGECNELGEYGYCRDRKRGKKQIVIGLLTAADGEPLSVKVFKGNTSDPTTISSQIEVLKKRFGIEDVVFVGDRGMVKSKGKEALKESGLKYITALTNPQVRRLLKENILQPDLFDQTICEVEHGNLRLVLRKNEKVFRKEQRRREDKLSRLMQLVDERNCFVSDSKRADAAAGLRRLTNWAARYKIASFVSLSLDGPRIVLVVDESAKAQAGLLDGCYVLETDVSLDKMDAKTIDERYRSLQLVERDFRRLKNGFLEIRPVYVRKKERTCAHVLVAMLALKIIREAEEMLREAFPPTKQNLCPLTLEDSLRTLSRLCFLRYQIKDTELLRLPQLDDRQLAVFKALKFRPPKNKTSHKLSAEAA
jgi:transposase